MNDFDPRAGVPFDDSEAVEFSDDAVPEDVYELRVLKARPSKSSQKGTPMIDWEFVIEDGQDTGGDYAGRRLWHSTPTTGKGAGLTKAVVLALVPDFNDWVASLPSGQITQDVCEDFVGEVLEARVVQENRLKDGNVVLDDSGNPKKKNTIRKIFH